MNIYEKGFQNQNIILIFWFKQNNGNYNHLERIVISSKHYTVCLCCFLLLDFNLRVAEIFTVFIKFIRRIFHLRHFWWRTMHLFQSKPFPHPVDPFFWRWNFIWMYTAWNYYIHTIVIIVYYCCEVEKSLLKLDWQWIDFPWKSLNPTIRYSIYRICLL